MKVFLSLFLLSALLFYACKTEQLKCETVKTGKFYYYSKATFEKVYVERDSNLQVETTVNGTMIRSKIVWKGECKYEMYINSENQKELSQFDSQITRTPAEIEITQVGKNFYTYKATFKEPGVLMELTDTIYFSK